MFVQKICSVALRTNLNNAQSNNKLQNHATNTQWSGNARIPSFALYFTGAYPQGILEKAYFERAQIFASIRQYLSNAVHSAIETEEFVDKLGQMKLIALDKNDSETVNKIDAIAKQMFKNPEKISLESYIRGLKGRLEKAIETGQNIVFVKGHKNPDVDSVSSAILEAYRNSCIDNKTTYIPIIDGNYLGGDVRHMLEEGEEKSLIFSEDELYKKASANPNTKWIFVDHNKELPLQNRVIKIIDHHHLKDEAKNPDIPITAEHTGSTAALIVIRMLGSGVEIGQKAAKILYAAALRDTENYKPRKMKEKDICAMKYLKAKAQVGESFYGDMMRAFINVPKTAHQLFHEDYKHDGFGYAVCATSEFFKGGHILPQHNQIVEDIISVAKQNNHDGNFPFTLVHFQDFASNCEYIENQRMYVVFNESLSEEKQKEIFGKASEILREMAHGHANISTDPKKHFIDIIDSPEKISRKRFGPKLRAALGIS